jgi:4-hydroxybenzoate polyprenyltransferase
LHPRLNPVSTAKPENMNLLLSFLKLVRFSNLVIVALTQYLLQYLVLLPALREAGLPPILDGPHFFLLVLATVLIAAGGYLINDILDYESDLINKPDLVFVNRVFSMQAVWTSYLASILIGFAIAWYLALYVHNLPLVLIYPAAVLSLFFYSKKLKKIPFWGNLVVALFCAFVAGIVLFAERENFLRMGEPGRVVQVLFGGYLLFAFLSTLLREIVKDLEDIEGDAKLGLRTLPLVFGEKAARRWALGAGFLLLASLLVFLYWLWVREGYLGFAFAVVAVALPLGYCLAFLAKSRSKTQYKQASTLAKLVMLTGLILLVICTFA